MINVVCSVEGCDRPRKARGFCRRHYDRFMRNGTPVYVNNYVKGTPEERFWAKTIKRGPDECWDWTGTKDRYGYGVLGIPRDDQPKRYMNITAHRFSFILHGGDIPLVAQKSTPDHTLDHLCYNRACVNPKHLEVVPIGENARRGRRRMSIHADELLPVLRRLAANGERITTTRVAQELGTSARRAGIAMNYLRQETGVLNPVRFGSRSYWVLAEETT